MNYYIIVVRDVAFYNLLVIWIQKMQGIANAQYNRGKQAIRFESKNLYCIPHLIHFLQTKVKRTV